MATVPPSHVSGAPGGEMRNNPLLTVLVQPNRNQKRRYNSDGPTRGQIKDDSGERVPTVRLDNFQRPVLMYMMACTSNGEPHPFFELQSVDKCGCKQSELDHRPAVVTETSPDKAMEARFAACLKRLAMRIVQETNEHDFTKWKCESEKVHLGFLAVALPGHVPLASCLSEPIHMVQGRQLELKRIIPSTGTANGETLVCITGKNFPASSNLKVRFFLNDGPDKPVWESYGDVDNSDSSEKHLVVTVPRGPGLCAQRDTVQVAVEILPATTTATRTKVRNLYYSYMSPQTSGSHPTYASRIKRMHEEVVAFRESAQSQIRALEPNTTTNLLDPTSLPRFGGGAAVLPQDMVNPLRGVGGGGGFLTDQRLAAITGQQQQQHATPDFYHAAAAAATPAVNDFQPLGWLASASSMDESMESASVASPGSVLTHPPLPATTGAGPSLSAAAAAVAARHPHRPSIKTEMPPQMSGSLKRANPGAEAADGPAAKILVPNHQMLQQHQQHQQHAGQSRAANGGVMLSSLGTSSLGNLQHNLLGHANTADPSALDSPFTTVFSPEACSTAAQPSPALSQQSMATVETNYAGLQHELNADTSESLTYYNHMGTVPQDFLMNFDHYTEENIKGFVNAVDNGQQMSAGPYGQQQQQRPQQQASLSSQVPGQPGH